MDDLIHVDLRKQFFEIFLSDTVDCVLLTRRTKSNGYQMTLAV